MAKSLISDPIWPPQNFFMVFFSTSNRKRLSFYVISRKTKEPHLTKWQKNLILGPILAQLAQVWVWKFFCRFYL